MYYGALEAGGTKMVLAVMNDSGKTESRVSIPTRSPEETMPAMIDYFRVWDLSALGIGCFGPLDLNPRSDTFGFITMTPKLPWRNYPIYREFSRKLGIPVAIDTDVNGAALAEVELGAARGSSVSLYVTVGTGIGGGLILNGTPVHGLMHPEIGHISIVPSPDDPAPDGFCPYHRHCLEGLAAGPAIEKRWGQSARQLPADHPAWELEVYYLAQLCATALLCFSPEKIILGGGVMQQKFLFPLIRKKTLELLNGYIPVQLLGNLENCIVEPALGTESGITGAYLLARGAALGNPDRRG